MIGAMDISERAKFLEEASKESDEAKVNTKHADLMEDYGKLIRTIYDTYGEGRNKAPEPEPEDADAQEGDVLEFGPKGGDS